MTDRSQTRQQREKSPFRAIWAHSAALIFVSLELGLCAARSRYTGTVLSVCIVCP